MVRTTRAVAALAALSLTVLAACGGDGDGGGETGTSPSASPAETSASETAPPSVTLPGTILFGRMDGATETYLTIAPDGTDEHAIFEAEECAPCVFLSPDGSQVMTASFTDDGRLATATINADGTDEFVLPLPNDTINLGPGAWSPDGTQLALFGFDDAHPSRTGIYIAAAADGSDLTQITTSEDGRFQEPIAWSPDGTRLLFFVDEGSVGPFTHSGDLSVVSVDGNGLQRLNPSGVVISRVKASGTPASWSPDGNQVAFGGIDAENNGTRSAMFVVDPDGGDALRLTEWGGVIASAEWSPSGDWIAFSDLVSPSVSIVHPDGTELVTLASSADQSCCPVWSPDGTYLLVQRGADGVRDLWIIDLAGEVVGQVTNAPGEYFGYEWRASL